VKPEVISRIADHLRYEEVYGPDKLTAGNTVHLVLNYSQADFDLFMKNYYINQSAYILRKECVFSVLTRDI